MPLPKTDPARPVLIAGPTASGKSALALSLAEAEGGVIVNADALQVFENWRILTARPGPEEEARAPHALYGHVPYDADYSVGHWLREVAPILAGAARPIVVGGTGLYFTALTEGLAEIPETPADLRALADRRRLAEGHQALLAELDAETRARVDPLNPMRVQRAWEVLQATGKGLAAWQAQTPPALLPLARAQAFVLQADRDWLAARIDRRFDAMLRHGVLDEVRANLARWNPAHLSSRAIGAPELIAHLQGKLSLEEATARAKTASRQYAKRQRTWFRARMREWQQISAQ
ncbi:MULTISPECIES: tRNA (adenosine(37)-N6)-dimethylallyltransferase MiaA [Actibacterium]|uniref:tRNA dimethylallyltransferase n=1 Tax=Actibacterium naphthalenivorans TaxID=1614693 RepID=A0A840CDG0_9RHOB|nr:MULTISPECIES: tRNA (adenosine(37)-N6)-dimethylallyltransferase MiaA [Actibacterium]ALG90226.1 tRNA delta(2)-isopentenylpyrophosphate transferase [Actibacterium sp. EMB200-NS6]MBB4022122.1 tRNA dimethylallyltransferase [Actibacterium naphthalenivorans]